MTDKENHHEEQHSERVHYVEVPKSRNITDFFGVKELITLVGFAVTVGMGWASLSGQLMLLDQRLQYKESQLKTDIVHLNENIKDLSVELKAQKNANTKLTERIRESEENVRRLWADIKRR